MPLNRLTAGPALVPSKQPQAARQPGEATARFRAAVRHQGTGNSSSRHRYACASAWRIHKTVNLPCVRACGVGTFTDIVRYLDVDGWRDRLPPGPYGSAERRATPTQPIAKRLVSEIVEEGRLLLTRVDGWKELSYLHPHARVSRSVDARALITAFDSLAWERDRVARMIGMRYTIEMYSAAEADLQLLRVPVSARRYACRTS